MEMGGKVIWQAMNVVQMIASQIMSVFRQHVALQHIRERDALARCRRVEVGVKVTRGGCDRRVNGRVAHRGSPLIAAGHDSSAACTGVCLYPSSISYTLRSTNSAPRHTGEAGRRSRG